VAYRVVKYTKILDDFERGYLAAMFDGEGTIGVVAEKREENVSGIRFSPNVCIYNSDHSLLEAIQEMVGFGSIFCHGKSSSKRKAMYRLHFTANQVRHLLPQLLSGLVAKKRQAELVLSYLSLAEMGCHTAHLYESFLTIYWELRNLNARGAGVSYSRKEIEEYLENMIEREEE